MRRVKKARKVVEEIVILRRNEMGACPCTIMTNTPAAGQLEEVEENCPENNGIMKDSRPE